MGTTSHEVTKKDEIPCHVQNDVQTNLPCNWTKHVLHWNNQNVHVNKLKVKEMKTSIASLNCKLCTTMLRMENERLKVTSTPSKRRLKNLRTRLKLQMIEQLKLVVKL